jgi:hypothetical protein
MLDDSNADTEVVMLMSIEDGSKLCFEPFHLALQRSLHCGGERL